ncbi:MAG: sigma-70 family RNA polymerase sigma factor [Acidimicrobiia bacterium]|nr:sigma-70 family RNA polymerase sigma factor [Acidimicrobiia bacterium]
MFDSVRNTRRMRMNAAAEDPVVVGLESFEAFYAREFRPMVGLAFALSGSRLGAEDIAQEAMMVAHKKWDEVALMERPDAWVRRVVSNMAVSAYRRRLSEARAIARLAGRRSEPIPALEAPDAEFWKAVRALPGKQAQAIALHYIEDMPVAEIAEVLDCSPSTAKVHLFRGRKNLAAALGLEDRS